MHLSKPKDRKKRCSNVAANPKDYAAREKMLRGLLEGREYIALCSFVGGAFAFWF
jgi:hypothetical protein